MVRTIEVPGDQIEVHADIGPGRVVRAILVVEELAPNENRQVPTQAAIDQWEKDFDELCALSPLNPYPVDDSREAIYGPDAEEADPR